MKHIMAICKVWSGLFHEKEKCRYKILQIYSIAAFSKSDCLDISDPFSSDDLRNMYSLGDLVNWDNEDSFRVSAMSSPELAQIPEAKRGDLVELSHRQFRELKKRCKITVESNIWRSTLYRT